MNLKLNNLSRAQVSAVSSRSRNLMVEVGFLLIVIVLLYWFIVRPKVAVRDQKTVELQTATAQKESVEKDVANLEKLSADLKQSSSEITHLDEALPLNLRTVRLQALLERLSKQSGAIVGSIGIDGGQGQIAAGDINLLKDPYAPARTLSALNVNITLSGTMSQLQDFLKKVESYGRIMDISSLALAFNHDDILDLKLSLSTYYFGTE